ncbi:hypothetical protein BHU24_17985 [Bacillus pseudomycoides]|nr:hypothetical protein [Bacillus pseudomycoides]PEO84603.1 hypothetical protein CN571_22750 [Bacillus pseudomycoides]
MAKTAILCFLLQFLPPSKGRDNTKYTNLILNRGTETSHAVKGSLWDLIMVQLMMGKVLKIIPY